MEDIEKLRQGSLALYQKMSFGGVSDSGKLAGISVVTAKVKILKKINISFIVHFFLGKCSFSIDTLKTHLAYS